MTTYIEQLRETLIKTKEHIPEGEFCGLGVILYSDFESLPILPLYLEQVINVEKNLEEQLASASLYSNPCHDGFHLISDNFELTHINQYFGPPLPSDKQAYKNQTTNHGARYISAQIGSLIHSIHCIGIVSEKDELFIFENGKEVK